MENLPMGLSPSMGADLTHAILSETQALIDPKKRIIRFDCSRCFKREMFDRFSLCGRCEKIRYCSRECQKADWSRHKVFCPTVDEERGTETLEEKRSALGKKLTEAMDAQKTHFVANAQRLKDVARSMNLQQGVYYRYDVREKCIGALARGAMDELNKNIELYFLCNEENLKKQFPDQSLELSEEESVARPREGLNQIIFDTQFKNRLIKAQLLKNKEAFPVLDRMMKGFKVLQPHQATGSVFLHQGYPPDVKKALEDLRQKIIQIVVQNLIHRKSEMNAYLMAWVFAKVSRLSCIDPKSYPTFIFAIENEDGPLMLSCLNCIPILDEFVKNSEFLDEISTQKPFNFKLSHFKEVIEIIKSPIGNSIKPSLALFGSSQDADNIGEAFRGKIYHDYAKRMAVLVVDEDSLTYLPLLALAEEYAISSVIVYYFCEHISEDFIRGLKTLKI